MSNPNEKDAVARAMYLEMRKGAYTYQLVVTPDTVSIDKTKVYPATMLSRRISVFHPRKNWGFTKSNARVERDADGNIMQMPTTEAVKEYANKRADQVLAFLMDNMFTKGYTLHAQPIFVEMTYKDAENIYQQKTPNELWRRIVRSRTEFGFGEEFFNTVA